MLTDPIADMLTRIRNAQAAEKVSVVLPLSRVKIAIAQVLQDEGYVSDFNEKTIDGKPMLEINLKYYEGSPVISSIQRVSTPGRRVYQGKDEIMRVAGGLGVAVVSTSNGIMSDRVARKAGIGGEILCVVS